MVRLAGLLILALVLGAGAAWLADQPGAVTIRLQDSIVETSLAALALLVALVLAAGAILLRLYQFLRHGLPFAGANRARRRERMGYAALNKAMVALSSGDTRQASRQAKRAQEFLPAQPLTHVIGAEAARLSGDGAAVIGHYQALTDDRASAFLGLRGLIAEARRTGQTDEALTLTRQALDLKPDNPWALQTLFDLTLARAEWGEALALADRLAARKLMEKDRVTRLQAVLAYCQGVEADLAGDTDKALSLAQRGHDLDPGFSPAAQLAARLARDAGRRKQAEKVLRKAWTAAPHPSLMAVWDSLEPHGTPSERLRRRRDLVAGNAAHSESRYQLAVAQTTNDQWAEAQKTLEPLLSEKPGARVLRLMASIARHRGGTAAGHSAADWQTRADLDGRDPGWVCGTCGAHRTRWTPICPSCHDFDSYRWTQTAVLARTPALGRSADTLALLASSAPADGAGVARPDME